MNINSYYDILEISKSANETEIKKSYKKLASKWHPDKNLNNIEESTEKFKKISEAYNVLIDPVKRQIYDNYGENFENHYNEEELNPFDIFNDYQENNFMKSQMKFISIKIKLENIFKGIDKKIKIKSKQKCNQCDLIMKKCNECDGKGIQIKIIQRGFMIQKIQTVCNSCNETGFIKINSKCKKCDGKGTVEKQEFINIKINKNEDYKKKIILKEKGNFNFKTKKNDDIYVELEFNEENYKIENYDIIYNYSIHIRDALCEKELILNHPNGKMYLIKNNKIIKDNEMKIIKKFGLPSKYSFGDLILKMNYIYPNNLLSEINFKDFIAKSINMKKYEDCEKLEMFDFKKHKKKNKKMSDENKTQCHQS